MSRDTSTIVTKYNIFQKHLWITQEYDNYIAPSYISSTHCATYSIQCNICDLMAYDFYFLHPLAAETASAQINIIVKPRDSNNVLPEENTNEFSIPAHNGWQPDYEKNLIKSQDNNRVYGHVVKHGDDYSYGAVTPNSWSDDKLHMRFNEVSAKPIL